MTTLVQRLRDAFTLYKFCPVLTEAADALERLEQERDALRHGHDLIQTTLERFTTDCSTPTFQLARNAMETLEQAEAEVARLRDEYAQVAAFFYGEAEYDHDGLLVRVTRALNDNARLRGLLARVYEQTPLGLPMSGELRAELRSALAERGEGEER